MIEFILLAFLLGMGVGAFLAVRCMIQGLPLSIMDFIPRSKMPALPKAEPQPIALREMPAPPQPVQLRRISTALQRIDQ